MRSDRESPAAAKRPAERDDLTAAAQQRLEADWRLPMSERLAQVHELCRQMTALAGSAKRR